MPEGNKTFVKFGIFLMSLTLALIFCCTPATYAQTMTAAQKQDLINKIQQQLVQLNQQITQTLAQQQGTVAWCYTFNNNLGFANSGTSDVVNLHLVLQKQGTSYSPDDVNTYSYGTSKAVIQFQAKYKISPQSGFVGKVTRAKLNQLYGCATAAASNSNPAITSPTPVVNSSSPLSGSLDLIESTTYPSQSVIAPQTKFKLADFSLTNNTTEPINLNKINVNSSVGSNLYSANLYVTNFYVVYGSNTTPILKTITNNDNWAISSQLPAGQTTDLSVYGDISSSIPLGSVINCSLLVTGISAVSGTVVTTNSNAVLPGQNITFGSESLAVNQDNSTPPSRIVAVNQRVVAGKFQFTSTGDSYTVSELKFSIPNPNTTLNIYDAVPSISDAVLSDTATQALLSAKQVLVTYDGIHYNFDFNNLNIPIPLNSTKSVTISYDLNSQIDSDTANTNIAPVLSYVKASNSSGALIDGLAANYNNVGAVYNNLSLPVAGVTVNGLYIFKSIPTFNYIPSSNANVSNGSNINLYTFSISADQNSDISVKQLTFAISFSDPNLSNPSLNNFTFMKGNSDYTPAVSIGNIINNKYINLSNSNGIGGGITNMIVVTFGTEEKIPAGKTQIYTLKALVNNLVSSSTLGADSISINMPGDTDLLYGGRSLKTISLNVYYGLFKNPTDIYPTPYNVLWSDKSELFPSPHNDLNGNYTDDWYNGFDVSNLPLTAQTINGQ